MNGSGNQHIFPMLEGVAADPDRHISELPLLTEAERHRQLVEWNDTETEYPRDRCVHELFEAQAERTPDAVAVVYDDQRLTYRELEGRANQLARHLRELGVGPEVLVGICVERSLEMVVGLLGILKSGGAYVPLDPSYPRERLEFMLEDTGAPVLLTQDRLVGGLPEHGARVVRLDSDWSRIALHDEGRLLGGVSPENLAYVIYTSGSTGKPKGVTMNNAPLVNLLHWQLREWAGNDGARTLQFASLNFDVSFQEIFSTLCSGGVLFLLPDELRQDPMLLLQLLQDERIHRIFVPFVALQQLAQAAEEANIFPADLAEIITAGEQLHITSSLREFCTQRGYCSLHNQYGPSETHVVTSFVLRGNAADWPSLPPIGRPIANTRVYILDADLQPVPVSVPGEIYIGGVGLARGYLNRPELTAEKFIPDPFSSQPGSRLYRTGDLARYLPDGNIEFLGRIDDQVKIRGFRIELGEVEAALAQHPGVRQTVVLAREDTPGEKRLVGYVVGDIDGGLAAGELRDFLKEKLPEYMVPSAFVVLGALPLTPNGKVDRKALPPPDPFRFDVGGTCTRPHTPTEEVLAGIWAGVLGLECVGIHDDFVALGGHSLLAAQVISRVRDVFDVELPIRSLFSAGTIAGWALLIEERILQEVEQLDDSEVQRFLSGEMMDSV